MRDTGRPRSPTPPVPTRERILRAAARLFYARGIGAVGVDAVAAGAGVTKRTLYYHFRSKDDLIAACLDQRDQPNLIWFRRCYDASEGDVAARIEALFAELARAAAHRSWKGCGFLRTSVELVNLPGHPAILAGRRHKRRLEDWLCELFDKAGAPDSRELARQVLLLIDGAFAVVLLHRDTAYMESAGRAAAALVRAGLASSAARRADGAACGAPPS